MFSKDITEHDNFLEMPLSSQALYFHLGMQADDDGFVSPNRIVRMIGSQNDDLKILVAKKFVLQFDDGFVVIKHWKINNYLRSDRYKKSPHKEKMALLSLKDNNAYSWYTNGIPLVDAGKVRLGKVISESKDSAEENMFNSKSDDYLEGEVNYDTGEVTPLKEERKKKYPNAPAIRKLFQEIIGRNPANWKVNKTQLQACENLSTERGLESVRKALEFYKRHENDEYIPSIDSPYDLDSKWTKLGKYKIKHGD